MTPKISAARATTGRTNPFADFQVSRPIPDEMSMIDANLVIFPPFFMQASGQLPPTQGFRSRFHDAILFSRSGHRPCERWRLRDETHGYHVLRRLRPYPDGQHFAPAIPLRSRRS